MRRILAAIFIFMVVLAETGCTTMKIISSENDIKLKSDNNYLVLHTPETVFKVTNYNFSEEYLTGELYRFSGNKINVLHVYTDMDFVLNRPNTSGTELNLPRNNITKIALKKISIGKTAALAGSVILAGILIGSSVTYDVGPLLTELPY